MAGFLSKKEAQAALADALSAFQRGLYIAPSRQTLREFLDVWLEGVRSALALTAWTNYRDVIRLYVVPHLGSRRLTELSSLHLLEPRQLEPGLGRALAEGAAQGDGGLVSGPGFNVPHGDGR